MKNKNRFKKVAIILGVVFIAFVVLIVLAGSDSEKSSYTTNSTTITITERITENSTEPTIESTTITTTNNTTEKETTTKKETTTEKQTTTKKATKPKQTTTKKTNSPNSNGASVYRTPSGKRYHYDPDCGGKNSYKVSLDNAKSAGLTPCQKCVQ